MTLDLEKYTMTDGQTDLCAAELNARFYAIVRRLHALEQLSIDWSAAVSSVQNYGLARINNAVQPLIDSLKVDLVALIAQGRTDLASQSAAVDAMLADVDTRMAAVEAMITASTASVTAHAARLDNPHQVTAAQVAAVPLVAMGVAEGVATLDASARIPAAQVGNHAAQHYPGGRDPLPYAPRDNLIINPVFSVNQRGYVSGTATTKANQYTLDRWRVVVAGQSVSWTASGIGNIVNAPAGGMEQVVAGDNIFGGFYVLSWEGTASATINGTAIVNGGAVTLPTGSNATIKLSSGSVGRAKLEEGDVATPFSYKGTCAELFKCQYYYVPSAPFHFYNYAANSGAVIHYEYFTPRAMRTTPYANIASVSLANCTVGSVNDDGDHRSFWITIVATNVGQVYSCLLVGPFDAEI